MHTKSAIHRFLSKGTVSASLASTLGPKLLVAALVGSLTACEVAQNPDSSTIDSSTVSSLVESAISADAGTTESTMSTDTGTTVEALQIDLGTPANYQLDLLQTGKTIYIDRDYVFTDIPPTYDGLCYVRTANDDKYYAGDQFTTFTVNKPVTVFVGYDPRNTVLPAWLHSWTATEDMLTATDVDPTGGVLRLYRKDFPAGTIALGGNEMGYGMYTVLIEDPDPASNRPCEIGGDTTLQLKWIPTSDQILGYKIYSNDPSGTSKTLVREMPVSQVDPEATVVAAEFRAWYDLNSRPGDTVCLQVSTYDATGESPSSDALCETI